MRYFPHTQKEIESMLKAMGRGSLDELFSPIPQDCRRDQEMDLPEPFTEWELNDLMNALAGTQAASPDQKVFIGAGSYEHHIPSAVSFLLSRSEFVTSYTPYQPEMAQGTLQGTYEYQTLVTRLLGMEVANASLYDGASALAEAVLMAIRISRKTRVAVSGLVHPLYRRVLQTYLGPGGYEVLELPRNENGTTDTSPLGGMKDLAAVVVQSPNFFGCIEPLRLVGERAHEKEALLVVNFTEFLAYGLLKNPGQQGADIVSGEGQSMGIVQSYGGPGLGVLASKMKWVRNMPGRLVGKTVDREGRRGFVLTLATREQHIRREKATSNICTNNSLCALAASMYLACLGRNGIRELARLNYDKAQYLKAGLQEAGVRIPFEASTFNEFVAEFPWAFKKRYSELARKGMVVGLPLGPYYPELDRHYLLCVTETKTKSDMDRLIEGVK